MQWFATYLGQYESWWSLCNTKRLYLASYPVVHRPPVFTDGKIGMDHFSQVLPWISKVFHHFKDSSPIVCSIVGDFPWRFSSSSRIPGCVNRGGKNRSVPRQISRSPGRSRSRQIFGKCQVYSSGWWARATPLKNIEKYERQLGWWDKPNINGKIKNGNQTTNQS